MKPPKPTPTTPAPARKSKPKYIPTEKDRRAVKAMVGVGITHEELCVVLAISKPTLYRHYKREIATGWVEMVARMRVKLVNKADSGDTLALIHVNKVMGWNDRLIVVDGGTEVDPRTASETDLDAEIARLKQRPAVVRHLKAATVH